MFTNLKKNCTNYVKLAKCLVSAQVAIKSHCAYSHCRLLPFVIATLSETLLCWFPPGVSAHLNLAVAILLPTFLHWFASVLSIVLHTQYQCWPCSMPNFKHLWHREHTSLLIFLRYFPTDFAITLVHTSHRIRQKSFFLSGVFHSHNKFLEPSKIIINYCIIIIIIINSYYNSII
jgi:hypothetical protein